MQKKFLCVLVFVLILCFSGGPILTVFGQDYSNDYFEDDYDDYGNDPFEDEPYPQDPPFLPRGRGERMAQKPGIQLSYLTISDGLSDDYINQIHQDQFGFVWLATRQGLNRFDGYSFKKFKHDKTNPASLSSNEVGLMLEGSDGIFWIVTENGDINRFDPKTELFSIVSLNIDHDKQENKFDIFTLFEDRQGLLWFGGAEGTDLIRYNPQTNQATQFAPLQKTPDGIPGNGYQSIIEDENGVLWIAEERAILRFDPQTEQFKNFPSPNKKERFIQIVQAEDQSMWVASHGGLYSFSPTTGQYQLHTLKNNRRLKLDVETILPTRQGLLWIATRKNGIYRFDPKTRQFLQAYLNNESDPEDFMLEEIYLIYEDQGGVMWIGTQSGVALLDPQQEQFSYLEDNGSDFSDGITALHGTPSGDVWLGSKKALRKYDPKTGRIQRLELHPAGPGRRGPGRRGPGPDRRGPGPGPGRKGPPPALEILDLSSAPNGVLWGAAEEVLFQLDPATMSLHQYSTRVLSEDKQGPPPQVQALHVDAGGMVWFIVDQDDLWRLDPQSSELTSIYQRGQVPSHGDYDEVISHHSTALFGDRMNRIWVGFDNGDLIQIDPESLALKSFPAEATQGGVRFKATIENFYQDKAGMIWISSRQGLMRFDPQSGRATAYDENDGLASSFALSVLEDDQGHLWISTRDGLSRFDPQSEKFKNFDVYDGLPSNNFIKAAWKTPNGQLFFSNKLGVTTFFPEDIQDNSFEPPVRLTQFRLYNEPVGLGNGSPLTHPIWQSDQMTLDHQDEIISFEFAALSYAASHKNRYRYKMDGFEKKWNEVSSSQRYATYTKLGAGTYTFRVQGANNNGVWSKNEAVIQLTVLPPWWETLWFRLLAAAGVLLSILGGIRWKLYAVEQRNNDLEEQVSLRTQELLQSHNELEEAKGKVDSVNLELASALVEVEEQHQILKEAQAHMVQTEKMASLGTLVAGVAHEINNPVNFVYMSMESLEDELKEHKSFLYDLLEEEHKILGLLDDHFEKVQMRLVDIGEGSQRIRHIVNDLRTFSRLDEAEHKPALMSEGLDSTIRLVKSKYRDSIEFVTHYNDDPEIVCWPSQLNQVFMNITVNACQAILTRQAEENMENEGKLVIKTSITGRDLEIQFEDNGIGMTEEVQQKIFEPFFTTKTVGEGTGMGMAISYGIIEKHKGRLSVVSSPGQGTSITLYIPLESADS